MTKRPLFWILLGLGCVLSAVFAVFSFPKAFPIVSLDLRMNRAAALRTARDLAKENGWGPRGAFRQAAWFGVDDTVRTFVELEGGGKEAFRDMLDRGLYAAYTWRVRNFKEGEAHETLVRFTPEGNAYGFRERLKESEPGPDLAEEQARMIAETGATGGWHINLGGYRRVETSKEVRLSGRGDHTFVYELLSAQAGAGRYRLRLVVSGQRLTELTHFLKVPEAFTRRYEEMRSANNGISFGAVVAMFVLYLIGGVVGLFVLLRQRWVLWRQPMLWAFAISVLVALAQLNEWPLTWMAYDTALPGNTFLLQRISAVVGLLVLNTLLLGLSFMAAESLGRRAFPNHPQLWRAWSRPAAGTVQVLGRTAGGYLYTGIEFAYIVGFYLIASRAFGWWTPSEALVEPNILATYVPWLSAVAPSIQAGVWEEALFRAVPIAGAALIGERFGNRKAWIIGALILQAVVFGSAHANYPSEPPYSRPIELIIPSLIWGIVYIKFGLLPTAITHFLFDAVLFAIPLFTASSPNAWIDQTMIILCMLVPLGIVVVGRIRAGAWKQLHESLLNRAWTPAPAAAVGLYEPMAEVPSGALITPGRTRLVLALGLIGLAIWIVPAFMKPDTPKFEVDRSRALRLAHQALAEHGFTPAPRWRTFASVEGGSEIKDQFVWNTSGADTYRSLLGTYLEPPRWQVRVATFEGDVAERAEEWQVAIAGDGTPLRIRHRLPQGRGGASLSAAEARVLAHRAVRERFGLEPSALKEVSAVSNQLPARRDWVFTFADTAATLLRQGELRLSAEVAGDRVVDAYRYVFVPEEWEREYRSRESLLGILRTPRFMVSALVIVAGAVVGIITWSRGAFPVSFGLRVFLILAVVMIAGFFNRWPAVESRFSTAQPLSLQTSIAAIAAVIFQLVFAAMIALLAALAHGRARATFASVPPARPWLGIAAGALGAGVLTLAGLMARSSAPTPLNYGPIEAYVPLVAEATASAVAMMTRTAVLMIALLFVHRATRGWTQQRLLFGGLLFLFGMLVGQAGNPQTAAMWLAQAALSGALLVAIYVLALRLDLSVMPLLVGTMMVLAALRSGIHQAFSGALIGSIIGAAAVAALAWWWYRELSRPPVGEVRS